MIRRLIILLLIAGCGDAPTTTPAAPVLVLILDENCDEKLSGKIKQETGEWATNTFIIELGDTLTFTLPSAGNYTIDVQDSDGEWAYDHIAKENVTTNKTMFCFN